MLSLGSRLQVGVGYDPRTWGLPLSVNLSRYDIGIYVLCVSLDISWFPVEWQETRRARRGSR